jgi:hypothetical protein
MATSSIAASFSSYLGSVSFTHILCEINHMTDGLAKQDVTRNYDFMA